MTTRFGYMIFYVDDVGATVDFFVNAFGMVKKFVTTENDYGELETGATTLAFAANELAASNLDAAGGYDAIVSSAKPIGAVMTLLSDDVAATIEAAVAAGASRYAPPVDKPWGQTVAYIRDPNGILIEVATPMAG